ncbi:MAG: alpha/beta fold hydrolase [Nevskia sp.]|nr:alpha/beta fold hydrolase [Nevskia sp.]
MFDRAPAASHSAEPFQPPWSLRHPSLQALLGSKRRAKQIWRKRGIDLDRISVDHIIECAQGVRLSGRHTPAAKLPARGLVVLIHGWEGHHDSSYLYSLACALHVAGYASFRLNLRDHGDTHALNEQMFHSARIDEVLDGVRAIQTIDAAKPLSVIGFSLGGNFALRVGLHGPAAGIQPRLCLGISPVLVPWHTLIALDEGPRVFHRYFLGKWRLTMDKKSAAWPERYDFTRHKRMTRFTELTRAFVEDHTEYATLDDYLAAYTLTPAQLIASPTPLALITARDDSVIPFADFDGLSKRGAVVSYQPTDHGGHCGFIRNWQLDSWAEAQALLLLQQHATE